MSEPWLRDAVTDHILEVFEAMDQQILSLGGAGPSAAALRTLRESNRGVVSSCMPIRDFDALVPVLEGFDGLIAALEHQDGELDHRIGGLLLQSVNTFKFAVKNLGQESKAAQLLPRLFQDLTHVYSKVLTRVAPKPTGDQPSFLSVKVFGQKYLIPCSHVSKVLCKPTMTKSPGRGKMGYRSILDAGSVIPVVEPEALGRREAVGKLAVRADGSSDEQWAVVLRSDAEVSDWSTVCLPVDSVEEIVQTHVLDAPVLDVHDVVKKAWAA